MRKGDSKRVIGFAGRPSAISVLVKGYNPDGVISRSFTVRLRDEATEGHVEDLRDFLLEAAKDWYEELKK